MKSHFSPNWKSSRCKNAPKCRRERRFLRRLSKNIEGGVGGTGSTPRSKLALATLLARHRRIEWASARVPPTPLVWGAGPGWPLWPLLEEDWSGSGAAEPFKPEVPSVTFGIHNCCPGPRWQMWPLLEEDWSGSGAFKPRCHPSLSESITAVLGLAGHCGHYWRKTGPAQARRSLSSPRCHPSLSESITAVLGLAGHCGHCWRKTGPAKQEKQRSTPVVVPGAALPWP